MNCHKKLLRLPMIGIAGLISVCSLLCSLLLAGLFSACSVEVSFHDSIDGNGDVVVEERRLAHGFSGVTLDGEGDVYIYPGESYKGESYKVVITTDSNIQDKIITRVDDNYLRIDRTDGWIFNPTKLRIDVYMPELRYVKLRGAGDIKIYNGAISKLEMILSGAGDIDARSYQVEDCEVKLSGVGTIKTWVTDTLDGKISGVGDILYKGYPRVNVSVSGVGKVQEL